MLKDFGVRNFDLAEALRTTDEEFCEKFDIEPTLLEEKKAKR